MRYLPAVLILVTIPWASAAPIDKQGRTVQPPLAAHESAQAKAHRAGVQAILNGKPTEAEAHFRASLESDPKFVPALLGLAALAQAANVLDETDKYLSAAEKIDPRAADVKLARGRYLMARGKLGEAEVAMKSAALAAPGKVPPLLELGDLYLRMPGRQAESLAAYRRAVEIDPKNAGAFYGLGAAAAANGRRADAIAALETAAALQPRDASAFRAIAGLQLEAGAFGKALSAIDGALARQPKLVPLMLDRADVLSRAGRSDDAIQQLQKAADAAPRSFEVRVKLGDTFVAAGKAAQAQAQYLKAIELEPKHPLAYNNLAWLTVERKGDVKMAVEWSKQAVALAPDAAAFRDTLGWALRAAGDLPAAISSLKRAVELDPKGAGYQYHLGIAQAENQNSTEARSTLNKALQLDPSLPDATKARDLLKSLPPS